MKSKTWLTFWSSDLLNRHRASHENAEQGERVIRRRTEKACQACIRSKTKCEEERPCKVSVVCGPVCSLTVMRADSRVAM